MDVEIGIKVMLRYILDVITSTYFEFPKKKKIDPAFAFSVSVTQEIKWSESFENKKYNLALASEMINKYVMMPGELFSFWHIIGEPRKRFKKGRVILRGKLSEDIGGGLCQVSGLIYHVSLLAGLEIVERHNHSLDLYTEETRYTPLGTDATVVYGYKDLRIKNNQKFPISFQLVQQQDTIEVQLLSPKFIKQHVLSFTIVKDEMTTSVRIEDEEKRLVSHSRYKVITP